MMIAKIATRSLIEADWFSRKPWRLQDFCFIRTKLSSSICFMAVLHTSILFLGCRSDIDNAFVLSDEHWRVETNLDAYAKGCNGDCVTLPSDFTLERVEIPLFSKDDQLVFKGRIVAIKDRGCIFNHESINWLMDYYIHLEEKPQNPSLRKIMVTVNMHGIKSIEPFAVGDDVLVVYLPSENVVVDLVMAPRENSRNDAKGKHKTNASIWRLVE